MSVDWELMLMPAGILIGIAAIIWAAFRQWP
jgi:hypothetical protein